MDIDVNCICNLHSQTRFTLSNTFSHIETPPDYFIKTCHEVQKRNVGFIIHNGSPYPGHIHKAQYKYIAARLLLEVSPNPVVAQISHMEINRGRFQKLQSKTHGFERTIVTAFYKKHDTIQWWPTLSQYIRGQIKLIWIATRLIEDAMAPVTPFEAQHRTTDVIGLVRQIRATEEFGLMPVLADALQEAGMEPENPLIIHYRDPNAKFSLGSWIFKASGNLEYSKPKKPDTNPASHGSDPKVPAGGD